MSFFKSPAKSDKGFVLIIVIWIAGLLSMMAATLVYSVRSQVRISGNLIENAKAEHLSEAGVMLALRYLMSRRTHFDRQESTTVQGGTVRSCRIAGLGTLHMRVQDEAGRVNLNTAGAPLLMALFQGVGVDAVSAARIADAVLDYRDADSERRPNGAESETYRTSNTKYGPKNAPFESIDEVDQVLGIDGELFRAIKPHITLYSASAGVDPAVMSASLRTILQQGILGLADAVPLRSDLTPGTWLPAIFTATSQRDVYAITAQAETVNGATFRRTAVVDFAPRNASAYRFRDWRLEQDVLFGDQPSPGDETPPEC